MGTGRFVRYVTTSEGAFCIGCGKLKDTDHVAGCYIGTLEVDEVKTLEWVSATDRAQVEIRRLKSDIWHVDKLELERRLTNILRMFDE